jgi:hypothetical protein
MYHVVPDDITNSISVVVVSLSIYYAYKVVQLSRDYEFVALKGGKAPYYIIIGLAFLLLDRIFDLLTNYLATIFGMQITVTFNDPPAAISGVFILLGLREMYVIYRKAEARKVEAPKGEDIWKVESDKSVV